MAIANLIPVKKHIDSMSQKEIKAYDFYSMPDESIEHLRAEFLILLKNNCLIAWFYEDCNLKPEKP